MNDKVECKLCNKFYKIITNTHLKKVHNTTISEYLILYPSSPLVSENIKIKISEKTQGKNNPMFGIKRYGSKNPFFNHKHSIESKNKQSISHRRENLSEETIVKLSLSQKGKIRSLESRLKQKINPSYKTISFRSKRKESMIGDKNPMWKGGISKLDYCQIFSDKEFKQMIKDRDGNRCLNPFCNKISNILNIHHINYDKQECDSMNLITLCKGCHSTTNHNREWYKEWYKIIIKHRNL